MRRFTDVRWFRCIMRQEAMKFPTGGQTHGKEPGSDIGREGSSLPMGGCTQRIFIKGQSLDVHKNCS